MLQRRGTICKPILIRKAYGWTNGGMILPFFSLSSSGPSHLSVSGASHITPYLTNMNKTPHSFKADLCVLQYIYFHYSIHPECVGYPLIDFPPSCRHDVMAPLIDFPPSCRHDVMASLIDFPPSCRHDVMASLIDFLHLVDTM